MTASRRVLRWEVPVDDHVHEIGGGRLLWVAARNLGVVEAWTEEDGSQPARLAVVVGTGHPIPEDATDHLGSTFDAGGALVWHLYEVRSWPSARGGIQVLRGGS
jgi:hypothetical protein